LAFQKNPSSYPQEGRLSVKIQKDFY